MKKAILTAALLAAASLTAQADTTLEFQGTGDQNFDRLLISNGLLRMDTGDGNWLLFDSNAQHMTYVDDSDRSYMVMDQAMFDKLGNTIDKARAELDAALAQMPPAQREQMRAMMESTMKGMLGGGEKISVELRETGASREVAGVDCRMVETWQGNKRLNQVCLANAADLKVAAGDARVFSAWAEFTEDMVQQMADRAQGLVPFEAPSFAAFSDGLPVLVIDEDGDKVMLNAQHQEAIDASLFTIPDNYSRESIDVDF
ncbi:MAG: hypothetical protein Tsb002_36670 [Wenzhouxiangellaceae bacterium]